MTTGIRKTAITGSAHRAGRSSRGLRKWRQTNERIDSRMWSKDNFRHRLRRYRDTDGSVAIPKRLGLEAVTRRVEGHGDITGR